MSWRTSCRRFARLDTTSADGAFHRWYRSRALPEIQKRQEKPAFAGARLFWSALLPDHPYGRVATVRELGAVTLEEAQEWIEETRVPRNTIVVLAGDLGPDADALVERWLGSWRGAFAGPPLPPPAPPPARPAGPPQAIVVDDPEAPVVDLGLGCRLPPADLAGKATNDVFAVALATLVLDGIRERRGASYGLSAAAARLRGGTAYLVGGGPVDDAALAATLAEIRDGVGRLAREPLDDDALRLARWDAARGTLLLTDRSMKLAHVVLASRLLGDPPDALSSYADRLLAVTADGVQAAARACAGSLVFLLAGRERVVRAAIPEGFSVAVPPAGPPR